MNTTTNAVARRVTNSTTAPAADHHRYSYSRIVRLGGHRVRGTHPARLLPRPIVRRSRGPS